MAGYTLAPTAKRDIADVRAWIARDDTAAARKWVERVRSKFRMLVRQPQIGEACESTEAGMRFVLVGSYVIYYVIQRGKVRIVRLVHGARDVNARMMGLDDEEA